MDPDDGVPVTPVIIVAAVCSGATFTVIPIGAVGCRPFVVGGVVVAASFGCLVVMCCGDTGVGGVAMGGPADESVVAVTLLGMMVCGSADAAVCLFVVAISGAAAEVDDVAVSPVHDGATFTVGDVVSVVVVDGSAVA